MSQQTSTPAGDRQNIFLVGPMGVGKTTIGRQLARRLHLEFHDSDQLIEARTGVDIPLIFEIEGEAGFRRREAQVIEEMTARTGIVLATGGGAVISPENREYLRQRGFTIYLCADPEQLLQRTARDSQRPLLQGEDRLDRIRSLLEQRDGFYREIADLIIDTDNLTVRRSVNAICRHLSNHENITGSAR